MVFGCVNKLVPSRFSEGDTTSVFPKSLLTSPPDFYSPHLPLFCVLQTVKWSTSLLFHFMCKKVFSDLTVKSWQWIGYLARPYNCILVIEIKFVPRCNWINRALKSTGTFLHDGGLFSVSGLDRERFLARIFNLSSARITATDARRVKRREN